MRCRDGLCQGQRRLSRSGADKRRRVRSVAVPVPATPLPVAVLLPVSVPVLAAAATSAAPATTGATPLQVATPGPSATLRVAAVTSGAPASTGGGAISKRSVKAKGSVAPLSPKRRSCNHKSFASSSESGPPLTTTLLQRRCLR